MKNDDDILEYALTYDSRKAAEKFNVSFEHVLDLVTRFNIETENLCPCAKTWIQQGIITMCFRCEGAPRDNIKNQCRNFKWE
jgi:hypothetical protein